MFVDDDGRAWSVGDYEVDSGELTFDPAVRHVLGEQAAAGYRAEVVDADEAAEVDVTTGLAATTPELEAGDELELRTVRSASGTRSLGRLELRSEAPVSFREGGLEAKDKWNAPITGVDDWQNQV